MTEVKGYTYHRVFDGYNFLSASGAMEEIVGTDMELVSKADHDAALRRAKAEGMREASDMVEDDCYALSESNVSDPTHAAKVLHNVNQQALSDKIDARAAQIEEGEDLK